MWINNPRVFSLKLLLNVVLIFCVFTSLFAQKTESQKHADGYFESGMELIQKERYAPAQKTFSEYILKGANTLKKIDARYYIALCALHLDQPQAEQLFKDFIADNPNHPKAEFANYDLGNFYYHKKNYEKAIQYLSKVDFSKFDKNERFEGQFNLGYSYFVTKQLDQAEPLFDKIKHTNHLFTYAANYYSGYIKFKNEKFNEAITDFRVAESNDAYKNIVPYMIINIYYQQHKYKELIAYGVEVLEKNPRVSNKAEILLLVGESYYQLQEYEAASEHLQAYIDASKSTDHGIQYRASYSFFQIKNYTQAINGFKTVASGKDTLSQYAAYYLGQSYIQTGNKTFAVQALEDARKNDFNTKITEQAYYDLIKLYYELEMFDKSIRVAKEFEKKYPKSVHMRQVEEIISESYLYTNNLDEALAYIESLPSKSQKVQASYQQLTYSKGVELFNKKQYKTAITYFEKSINHPVNNQTLVAAHFWRGESYSIVRQWEFAQGDYAKVFQLSSDDLSPYHLKSRYGIGYAYFNTKQYDKALTHFDAYTRKLENDKNKQQYGDALLRLADCHYHAKQYPKAVEGYEKAIKQKVKSIDYAYYQLGTVLGIERKIEEAQRNFDAVIKFKNSPYRSRATYKKANLSFEAGEFEQAIVDFNYFLTNEKGSPFTSVALLQRGLAYFNIKKYNAALEDFDAIINEYCTEKEAGQALTLAQRSLIAMNSADKFNLRLERYEQCNPSGEGLEKIRYDAAMEQYNNQQNKQAIVSFSKYLTMYPNSPYTKEVYYYLGESYFSEKQYDSASKYLELVYNGGPERFAERSLIRLSKITLDQEQYLKSKVFNKQLLKLANTKRKQLEALLNLIVIYYHLDKYDSCEVYANQVLAGDNQLVFASNKASLYKAKIEYKRGDKNAALDEFLHLTNSASDEYGAEANYFVGKIFYDQKDHKQSIESLTELSKNYATYYEWVGKAFMLIVDNYVALNEPYHARTTLQSLIDYFPDQKVVDKARLKMVEIDAMNSKTNAQKSTKENTKSNNTDIIPSDSLRIGSEEEQLEMDAPR